MTVGYYKKYISQFTLLFLFFEVNNIVEISNEYIQQKYFWIVNLYYKHKKQLLYFILWNYFFLK